LFSLHPAAAVCRALLIAGACAALALPAAAATTRVKSAKSAPQPAETPARYIAAGAFYVAPDNARGTDSGMGVNYGYAAALTQRSVWELRLFADTMETGIQGATDYYQYGAGLDLLWHFGRTAGGHPFALIGGGAVSNDVVPDDQDGISGYANLGLGWRSKPWRNWGLRHRLELRGIYDTFESGQVDVLAGVTLEIGAQRTRVVERVVEVEKIVEKEVIREVPTIAAVSDRDTDGIVDDRDKCPDTVAGAEVEADGCVRKEQVVVLPNIEFDFARAELTSAGREELGKVLRFMNDQPEIRLEVWGHTDALGTDAYNLKLSQQRAAAVVRFLTSNGIVPSRLDSAGFGESRPLADNETEEGQARNRRVELHIRASARGRK
jgi:OOP family OmpA-OmpF porin